MILELNLYGLHQKILFPLSGCDIIPVIIDWFSKKTIFILIVDTITLHKLAKLFVVYVFSKHGVLSYVTSNCRSEFVLNFFQFLGTTLDIQLHFMSRYHPKRDKKTEYTNQTLEQYLHIYYN